MAKIRKGDQIIVIAGKEKGKQGKVLAVMGDRIRVEGLNMVKKHKKGNPMLGTEGGIVSLEAPLHISNVAIFNKATGKADRVGIKTLQDGTRVRVFKSSGEEIKA